MNIKLISTLLITLISPLTTHAQGWDNLAWVKLLVFNHRDIGKCYTLLHDDDIAIFATDCDIGKLNDTENRAHREFYAQKLSHPLLTDKEFLLLYFVEEDAVLIVEQLEMSSRIQSGLMIMIIVEGIIHHDK